MAYEVSQLQECTKPMPTTEVRLWFQKSNKGYCELQRVLFVGNPVANEIMSVRGKTSGAYKSTGSFQWTPGVKGLVLVLIKTLLRHLKKIDSHLPILEGGRGSLAASLDYALDKQSEWLFNMFGEDGDGNAYLKRLLLRSNPGMKLAGPVGISVNEQLLPAHAITVYFSDTQIRHIEELDRLTETIIRTAGIIPRQRVFSSINLQLPVVSPIFSRMY